MGLFERFRNAKNKGTSSVKMVEISNDRFFAWNGAVYESDIVRSCIAPKVKAVGKLLAVHVRQDISKDGKREIKRNPEPYMRFLLEEPNPCMSGQKLQERLAAQLAINKNAFALIIRDEFGYPTALYPIPCSNAEAIYDREGKLFIRFTVTRKSSGNAIYIFPYCDLIHLTEDVTDNSIFGRPIFSSLAPLMEIVNTTDQGIVKAIKTSAVIRWLLKFSTTTRDEDIKKKTQAFADSFMDIDNGTGVAGINSTAEAIQIHPDNWTPNDGEMGATKARIYALFNTNDSIVTSKWTEAEWTAYFEAEIEPVLLDMQNEFTRKLFTRRERSVGNRIAFDASTINSETTTTKLAYQAMVDRKSMTPNEWRALFNWAPLPGGDEPIYWQNPKSE